MPQVMIGELLMRRGVSREALAQAWEQKILFGDRLGTNLLAELLVDEKTLALALGEQHATRAAYHELLRVDPRVRGLVKQNIIERHSVMPHHVDGSDLYLLMVDPHNVHAIDEVQATTRLTVQPVVVCEARMWRLLAEHYGISKSLRPVPLEGDPFLEAERAKRQTQEARAKAASGPELMDDQAFHALYAKEHEAPPSTAPVPPAPIPATPPAAPPADTVPPAAAIPLDTELFLPGVPVTPPLGTPAEEPLELVEEEELEPLSFDEARSLLAGVTDRDEIARVVLRCALGRFQRACLLTVHKSLVVGWEGGGPGCSTSVVRRFQLGADEESVFSLVRDSRGHYIGPLSKVKAHGSWVKLLGRQIPLSVAVFPVLVKGRVVNVLYGDNGHNEHVNPDVGELLILAQHIARSYEHLLADKGGAFS